MPNLEEVFVENMAWPPKGHEQRLLDLQKYNNLFECDKDTIKKWVKTIRKATDEQINREFVAYPAPEIAAKILASFLFGESAIITSDQVQEEIDELIEDNHLHALNQEGAITAAIEGEIYYKVDWDTEVSDSAIMSVMGGSLAYPRFRFGRLVEVAFVTLLDEVPKEKKVWRHVEIRKKGAIIHRVFKGSDSSLGTPVKLEDFADTEELAGEVNEDGEMEHNIDDTLVRHVPFWRTSSSPYGISIFRGKDGLIEALHSLYSQDQHDAEMAKRRMAVASNYLKRDAKGNPKFDRGTDIFELADEAAGAIGAESKPVHSIEFTDTTVMGQRIAQRFDEFLLACGIAPQSAGRDVSGAAESGTARRLAQSMTLMTVATASRYFTPNVRDIVDLALQVGAKQLGRTVKPGYSVKVALQDGMSDDIKELGQAALALTNAKAASTETKVKMIHPDWSDSEVQKEVARIKEEEGLDLPDALQVPDDPNANPEGNPQPSGPGTGGQGGQQ